MNVAELAAKHRAAKLAQLQRLRPKIGEAKQALEVIRGAQQNQGQARAAVELMQKLRHVPNFFPTPRALVQRMIAEADINPGDRILEPSAGKGDIVRAIWGKSQAEASLGANACRIVCVELVYNLAEHLRAISKPSPLNPNPAAPEYTAQWKTICADFLECGPELGEFDRVLMNPPFERGSDAKHIEHAFKFLAPGGKLVAICGSTTGSKLEPWIDAQGGWIEQLPAGSFANSERPTNVNTCLLSVRKASE